jgi:hypothetical protein
MEIPCPFAHLKRANYYKFPPGTERHAGASRT